MPQKTPLQKMVIYGAVLILTFLTGFVTGGIQKTYDPEDCNNTIREGSGAPAMEDGQQ
jgi:hypothetical protein